MSDPPLGPLFMQYYAVFEKKIAKIIDLRTLLWDWYTRLGNPGSPTLFLLENATIFTKSRICHFGTKGHIST